MEDLAKTLKEAHMTITSELLRPHAKTINDNITQSSALIADDMA